MIHALFVAEKGTYTTDPRFDAWTESRDARLFTGTGPVIAHPPCSRWCMLAGLVEAVHGYKVGADGGCFASALAAVRRCGGVLEHPAYSKAWAFFELARPPRKGGWVPAGDGIGYTCQVAQRNYGHPARKWTWLYAVRTDLPELIWGAGEPPTAKVSCAASAGKLAHKAGPLRRLSSKEASATPDAFKDVLVAMAESVRPQKA